VLKLLTKNPVLLSALLTQRGRTCPQSFAVLSMAASSNSRCATTARSGRCRHVTCDLLLQVKSIYGHSFDHSCILKWLQQHATCPITNQPLAVANLEPDVDLEKRIHAWQIQQTLKQQRLFDDMYEF
jgi:hypothetical protein